MPESKVRSGAKQKKQDKKARQLSELQADKAIQGHSSGAWVAPTFITVGLLGVAWTVVYQLAGNSIGFMSAIGDWNVLIGIGLIIASFVLATLWK